MALARRVASSSTARRMLHARFAAPRHALPPATERFQSVQRKFFGGATSTTITTPVAPSSVSLGDMDASPNAMDEATSLMDMLRSPDRKKVDLEQIHTALDALSIVGPKDAQRVESLAEALVEQSTASGLVPTVDTFNALIRIYVQTNNGKKAWILWKDLEMPSSAIAPNWTTCEQVLFAIAGAHAKPVANKALRILNYMDQQYQNGVFLEKPSYACYEAAISCLCRPRGASRLALEALVSMVQNEVKPKIGVYLPVVQALARDGYAEQAEQLVMQLVQVYGNDFDAELKPTQEPFQAVLYGWSKSKHKDRVKRAEAFLNHMREMSAANFVDCAPTTTCYNIVLHMWATSGDPNAGDGAMRLLDEMYLSDDKRALPDTRSLNHTLNACANTSNKTNRKSVAAENLLWKAEATHAASPNWFPPPDAVSYTTVLKAWAKAGTKDGPKHAKLIFNKILSNPSLELDTQLFANVLKCWTTSDEKSGADQARVILRMLFTKSMYEDGIPVPDVFCWNAVIHGYALRGDGENAEALLLELLDRYQSDQERCQSMKPNEASFASAMSAWAKTRNHRNAHERAESLLKEMERLARLGAIDDEPTVVHHSILIDCYAYQKSAWGATKAEQILRSLEESTNLEPTIVSYNSVLKAWSFVRGDEAARRVLEMFDDIISDDRELRPNLKTFGSVLLALERSDLPDRIERAEHVVATAQSYGLSLDSFCQLQLRRIHGRAEGKRGFSKRKGRRGE